MPRFYQPTALALKIEIELTDDVFHHACKVLRMEADDEITLFNGKGGEYNGKLIHADKKRARVLLSNFNNENRISSRKIHLAQVFNKGDKMDFVVEKATELGVSEITPLFSEHCDVRLSGERLEKKLSQLRNTVIAACEQCGMNIIPTVHDAIHFSDWIRAKPCEINLILDPTASGTLSNFIKSNASVSLVIGPEGGFSETEITQATSSGFNGIQLGQRILRTETAALSAISALQFG